MLRMYFLSNLTIDFRLVSTCHYSTCLNQGGIRTRFHLRVLNLYESAWDSDSFSLVTTQPVPICSGFGLVYTCDYSTCPNLLGIRTRFHLQLLNLSQSARDSDSFPLATTQPLRICIGFGLVSTCDYSTCPNRSGFGLVSTCNYSTCPNLLGIRTRFHLRLLNLSQSARNSDTFPLATTQPVRICSGFGLVSTCNYSTFTNQLGIRTRFHLRLLNLYESARDSDSFPLATTQPVPICSGFGLVSTCDYSTCTNLLGIRTRLPFLLLNLSEKQTRIRTRLIACTDKTKIESC